MLLRIGSIEFRDTRSKKIFITSTEINNYGLSLCSTRVDTLCFAPMEWWKNSEDN
jgi:hypothetical protein